MYGLNSGDTETDCVWNTGTPGNEDVHVDWFHGGQLIYSSDGAKKGLRPMYSSSIIVVHSTIIDMK